jgi:hypothetical protein
LCETCAAKASRPRNFTPLRKAIQLSLIQLIATRRSFQPAVHILHLLTGCHLVYALPVVRNRSQTPHRRVLLAGDHVATYGRCYAVDVRMCQCTQSDAVRQAGRPKSRNRGVRGSAPPSASSGTRSSSSCKTACCGGPPRGAPLRSWWSISHPMTSPAVRPGARWHRAACATGSPDRPDRQAAVQHCSQPTAASLGAPRPSPGRSAATLCTTAGSAPPEQLKYARAGCDNFTLHTQWEPLRPGFHLSVPYGWMNDPVGMFQLNEKHHLFFQYNPQALEW